MKLKNKLTFTIKRTLYFKHRLVEDEKNIAESLLFNLQIEYETVWASTGEEALKRFDEGLYSLIILDVMLPQKNGYEVCEAIRKKDSDVPILFLTAKGDVQDRIYGLKIGADDYLGKPFELEEFLLRVKALLKRRTEKTAGIFMIGDFQIDVQNLKAKSKDKEIDLTKKEGSLLKILYENEGQVVSREKILKEVWGYDTTPSTRTIDNFIVRLRNYFEEDPKIPKHIHSVHGVGYRFQK